MLATVSEEIERLQSLWRLMALGDLKSNLQSRKVWQKEIEEVSGGAQGQEENAGLKLMSPVEVFVHHESLSHRPSVILH